MQVSSSLAVDIQPIINVTLLTNRNCLRVVDLTGDNREEVRKVVNEWDEIYRQKYRAVHGGSFPIFRTIDQAYSDKGKLLKAGCSIARNISFALNPRESERPLGMKPWNKGLVCLDSMGKIQAVALFEESKDWTLLSHIVTHPDNIPHQINDTIPTKIKGAGTEIILELARRTLIAGNSIRLTSLDEAKGFYNKLNFELAPEDMGAARYKLTNEKIRNLIENNTPPFDRFAIEIGLE